MKQLPHHVLAIITLLLLGLGNNSGLEAQNLEREIHSFGPRETLVQPLTISPSPDRTSFAIADRQTRVAVVFDARGAMIWSSSAIPDLPRPSAVLLRNEKELWYFREKSSTAYRLTQTSNQSSLDSVVFTGHGKLNQIDQAVWLPGDQIVVLDNEEAQLLLFDSAGTFIRVIASRGQGKGKLWAPQAIALDLTGTILVADEKNTPVQGFTASGEATMQAGWNLPANERQWPASAVAISPEQQIWGADQLNRTWHLFDRSGVAQGTVPFPNGMMQPTSVAFSADRQLLVVDRRGALLIYSL